MESIAELLKTKREEAGIDIEEVSNDLDINELVLLNIEEGKIGAFKDISVLKEDIGAYAKYLGLDPVKIVDEFNEYLFEYTSRIPVKELENIITEQEKEKDDKVISPYTKMGIKKKKNLFILIYLLIFILVILAIFWSVNQITVENYNAYVVSYRK